MAGFVDWAKPDFKKFGDETKGLGDAFKRAIEALQATGDMKQDGEHDFPTQFFECWANPVMCLLTMFLPFYGCCLGGRTLEAVDSTYERELLNLIVTSVLYCGPCYHASRRTALRHKYNLKGSRGMDCLLSCFCGGCLMCQEAIAVHKIANVPFPIAYPPHDALTSIDGGKPGAAPAVAPVGGPVAPAPGAPQTYPVPAVGDTAPPVAAAQ